MEPLLNHRSPFLVLPPEELAQLQLLMQEERVPKGAWIFREGAPAMTLWVLLEGWVHLVRQASAGRLITIFTMTPSDALCGLSAFEQRTYTLGAVAATPCRLVALPAKYMVALLERYPAFAREVLSTAQLRMRHMADAICQAQEPVEHRLAHILLRLADQFGTTIPITHRELAQMAQTTVETSIRVMSRWRSDGFVDTHRGRVTLREPGRLSRLTNGNGRVAAR